MSSGKPYSGQDCSLARALEVVGERWTLLVLRDALFGVRRFTDLRQRLDIPRAVLVERLTTLVDAGLLERRPYRSGRDEYLPTERATALWPALLALLEWGEQYCAAPGGRRRLYRHVSCGTDLDTDGRCSSCGHRPAPAEVETRPGPGAVNSREDQVSVALREPHQLLTPLP